MFAPSIRRFVSLPQPAQDIREDGTAMLPRVPAVSPRMVHLVTRTRQVPPVGIAVGPFESGQHLLVREKPMSVLVVQIIRAVLQKNLYGFDRVLANERRIQISAGTHRLPIPRRTIRDRCVTADRAH